MKKLIEKLMALRGVLFFAFVIAGMVFAVKVSHDERVKQEQIAVEKAICELIGTPPQPSPEGREEEK